MQGMLLGGKVKSVRADLEGKKAVVECAPSVTDEALRAAVTGAGYTVTDIA